MPPLIFTVTVPLDNPLHVTFVWDVVTVRAVGCDMVTDKVDVQALKSVTVTV